MPCLDDRCHRINFLIKNPQRQNALNRASVSAQPRSQDGIQGLRLDLDLVVSLSKSHILPADCEFMVSIQIIDVKKSR